MTQHCKHIWNIFDIFFCDMNMKFPWNKQQFSIRHHFFARMEKNSSFAFCHFWHHDNEFFCNLFFSVFFIRIRCLLAKQNGTFKDTKLNKHVKQQMSKQQEDESILYIVSACDGKCCACVSMHVHICIVKLHQHFIHISSESYQNSMQRCWYYDAHQ